jgi:hypothetical protein
VLSCSELKSLPAYYNYPLVSIRAPTRHSIPVNKQDPIMVKNLVRILVEEESSNPRLI